MRHKGVGRAEMAERILSAAGRAFRKSGFSGVGVDGLAKFAGVTSGAFYSHFRSKDQAFEKALESGLDEVVASLIEFQTQHGALWVREFAAYYMGLAHRQDLECGCAMATMTPDVVRSAKAAHALYEKKMNAIVAVMVAGLSGGTDADLRARAWSVLGILIGGVNIARAVQSPQAAKEIAAAITAAAVDAAGPTRTPDIPSK